MNQELFYDLTDRMVTDQHCRSEQLNLAKIFMSKRAMQPDQPGLTKRSRKELIKSKKRPRAQTPVQQAHKALQVGGKGCKGHKEQHKQDQLQCSLQQSSEIQQSLLHEFVLDWGKNIPEVLHAASLESEMQPQSKIWNDDLEAEQYGAATGPVTKSEQIGVGLPPDLLSKTEDRTDGNFQDTSLEFPQYTQDTKAPDMYALSTEQAEKQEKAEKPSWSSVPHFFPPKDARPSSYCTRYWSSSTHGAYCSLSPLLHGIEQQLLQHQSQCTQLLTPTAAYDMKDCRWNEICNSFDFLLGQIKLQLLQDQLERLQQQHRHQQQNIASSGINNQLNPL